MDAYVVTADSKNEINFAPATVVEEVLQNVRTLLTTIKYQIPLDRAFGIDGQVVDLPMPQAQAIMSSEIFSALKYYEPRAEIQNISFDKDLSGKLIPKLEVTINEAG